MYHNPGTNGITWNGMHSCADLDAVCKSRSTPPPKPIKRHERVAYSNITWDFSALGGVREYENRTLSYVFTITELDWRRCRERVNAFLKWLYAPMSFQELWDSADPEYHYRAKLSSAVPSYTRGVCCEITAEFEAYPYRIPNADLAYPVDESYYPDLDGDGSVTALDALMIQDAAANVGAGEPSGLTPEQERRADADRDGEITASDAQLVLEFSASAGGGDYTDDPKGWAAFLNDQQGRKPEVI